MVRDNEGNALLTAPDGRTVAVPAEATERALRAGYTPAPPEQAHAHIRQHELRTRYGTTGQGVIAALEGVESGLTLGIAPWLRSQVGLRDEEAAAARREFHPGARTAGTIVGAVAPALVTGGGSLLAQGGARAAAAGAAQVGARSAAARALGTAGMSPLRSALAATPAGQVARAGAAVSRAVTGRLAPAGSSTARDIAARAAGMGLGGAAEGAAFGAGEVLDSVSLGNPTTIGEAAAATLAAGAGGGLFGAGMGGVVAGGSALARAAAKRLPTGRGDEWVVRWMEGRTPEGGYPEWLRRRGLTDKPDEIADLIKKRDAIIREPEVRDRLQDDLTERLQDQYSRVQWEIRDASTKVRPVEISRLIRQAEDAGQLGNWTGSYDEAVKTISKLHKEMTDRPDLHSSYYRGILQDIRDALTKATDASPAGAFTRLDQAKQRLDDFSKWGKDVDPRDRHSIEAFRSLRSTLARMLEDEGVWGAAGKRQREYNKALSKLLTAETKLEKAVAFPTVAESGAKIFEIDPTKLGVMMNNPSGGLGRRRAAAIKGYLDAVDGMREEIRRSMEQVPIDRRFNLDTTTTARNSYQTAWTAADATKRYKHRRGDSNILTSAPALRQAGTYLGGVASSLVGPAALAGVFGGSALAVGTGALGVGLAARRALRDPRQMIDLFSAYERGARRHGAKVQKLANALVKAPKETPRIRAAGSALVGKSLAGGLITKDGKLNPERAARLRAMASDPELLFDAVAELVPGDDSAPQITQAAQATVGRMYEFLGSKLPPERVAGPMGQPLEPSPAEVAKFRRYVEAATHPDRVLEHALAATLTPEHVEALEAVYPSLLLEIQIAILDALASPGANPSQRQRAMIGLLLGEDFDGTRALGASIRSRLSQQQGDQGTEGQGSPRATPARADQLDISSRVSTPQQRAAERE